jgi:hypothetical protein
MSSEAPHYESVVEYAVGRKDSHPRRSRAISRFNPTVSAKPALNAWIWYWRIVQSTSATAAERRAELLAAKLTVRNNNFNRESEAPD